jgi:hypothetical protein
MAFVYPAAATGPRTPRRRTLTRPGKGAEALIPADDATGLNLRGPRRGWEQAQSLLHPPLGGHIDDH